MTSKRVIQNPFAHNMAIPQASNTAITAEPPANPQPTGKYGAPPPVGSSGNNSPSSPAGSFGVTSPAPVASGSVGVYNPLSNAGIPPAQNFPQGPKYGAPPPAGASTPPQTAQPVTTQFTAQTPPTYSNPPQQQQAIPPSYGPPPTSGSTMEQQTTTPTNYGAPPAVGQPMPTPQQQLSPSEKALKFPSPIELIAGPSVEAVKFNTAIQPLPPPAASKFITVDQGKCGPRYIRSSLYTVPNKKDIAKKSNLPFGLIIQPLADPVLGEESVPIVDPGSSGPIRCTRCRGYMCSLNVFTDGGRKYSCFLCSHLNDVPDEYFSPIGANGYRMDFTQRPELMRGSVEYIASGEFVAKPPRPMSYVFIVEVSSSAIEQGVVQSFAASLKAILKALPEDNNSLFGLITYDSSIHFYNFHSSLTKPQMLVVADLEEIFLPISAEQNLLVNPNNSKDCMLSLLDELPQFTQQSMNTFNAFGSAIEAGKMMLGDSGGKMICFLSSLPNVAPGKLESRLKSEYLGTDREREFYKPHTSFYQLKAEKFASAKIGVDLFVFANTYLDLATILPLTTTTGGQLFYYPRFVPSRDRIKFHHEFHRVLTRTTGYDGVMRTRLSSGIDVSLFQGNHMLTYGTDMEVANIDCDKTFVLHLRNEDNIPEGQQVGIQCALLYTTRDGQRRIRIHSLQLPTSPQMANVFGGADLEAITYLITSKLLYASVSTALQDVRRRALDICVQIVYAFRFYCSTKSFNPQVLVIPEGLKLLPLYLICLLKNVFLKNGRVSVDYRMYSRSQLFSMSVRELTIFLYPRMFALHELPEEAGTMAQDGSIILPPWQRLLNCALKPDGCYLLDNGTRMFLWVGREVNQEFLKRVFDANTVDDDLSFNITDDPLANRVKAIISALQLEHPSYKLLVTVKQGGEKELLFVQMMFEERVEETMSHSDVLALVHREVCAKLGKPLK